MERTPAYFMEDSRESKRLAAKVDADQWVKTYLHSHLRGVRDVLDVGCGPGVIAGAIAQTDPDIHVVGLDSSQARIQEALAAMDHMPNVTAKLGSADRLPFEHNSFDLVYCRFLMEYLPNKRQAVEEMMRVCRSGGKVILQDLDGQLVWHYPEDEQIQEMINTVLQHLASTGFDPFVGRKLFGLAYAAGLTDIDVHIESYHLVAGKIDPHNLKLWELKLDIATPAIVRALGGEEAAEHLKQRFLDYLQRDDTLTYSVIFTVTGIKPV